MTPKHIIHVSSYYPPHLGGQENAVYDLAAQLAGTGHEIDVLTSTIGDGEKGTNIERGVRVNRMRGMVFGHAPILPSLPMALFRAARNGTIVHVHIGQAFTPEVVWLVSKLRGFKYIAELHIDFEPSGPAGILLPLYKQHVLKKVLQAADAVITLNQKTLQTVRDTYGYTGHAQVMNNGIDEVYFTLERPPLPRKPPQTLRLLFVGRLSKQKNVGALLEALRRTKRQMHVDIIGEGVEREALKKTIAGHELSNVIFHGRLTRPEVMEFYKTCDALIMPSLYEAQPLVLLEAMAARIPIIGTKVIGVEDHIKNAGILVEPTPAGLADGIEQYYTNYLALPEMVERGYGIAEELRWLHTLQKYEALYDAVA
jgi:rhamnosyl/mannosyltransferase